MTTRRRTWEPPSQPWVMKQSWVDLLFAHWPAPAAVLRRAVPPGVELDTYDGQAWLTVTPFEIQGLRPRLLPAIPWLSTFAELNLRTYVRRDDKPGIYFFSLDAASAVAVAAARLLLRLPYRHARMEVERAANGSIAYGSQRRGAEGIVFRARYRPAGAPFQAAQGSLDEWLAERYCLYTRIRGKWRRVEIDHPAWSLQPAAAQIDVNTLAAPLGLELGPPALVRFAARQDTLVWLPQAA